MGLTLLDMIVVCSGAVPALWLGSYFHDGWRTAVQYGGAFAFGIAFWCILFLWLLPLLERHGIIKPPSGDANPPAGKSKGDIRSGRKRGQEGQEPIP